MTAAQMSRAEREELGKLLRARIRVARNEIEAMRAVRLADFEEQLDRHFEPYEAAWADARKKADEAIEELNRQVEMECQRLGVPDSFRPRADVWWMSRGENAIKQRRIELRRVAERRLEATGKEARSAVDRAEADLLGDLIERGLQSADAKDWLGRLPQPESLVPVLLLREVDTAAAAGPRSLSRGPCEA